MQYLFYVYLDIVIILIVDVSLLAHPPESCDGILH